MGTAMVPEAGGDRKKGGSRRADARATAHRRGMERAAMQRCASFIALALAGITAAPCARAQQLPAPPPQDHGRFRFGADFALGFASVLSSSVAATGVAVCFLVRAGWQFSDVLALYYQAGVPGGVLWGTVRPSGSPIDQGLIGLWTNSALIELTAFNRLHLGLGPSVDGGAVQVCSSQASTGRYACVGSGGWGPGLDARIAYTAGPVRSGRRWGASFGVDLHGSLLFPTETALTALGVVGIDFN
jgi:hypothetical protein